MGIAFLASVAASIALGFGLHLFTNAIPKIARIAVSRAARRLPVLMKQTQEAAWLADLANLETHFEMLSCAIACYMTSWRVLPPFFAEKSVRELNKARVILRTHGAIASFAFHRIKAWDTSQDPKEWSIGEKWCVGVILACKEPMTRCMKEYFLALERDIKERPRQYKNQEEAAKDLFVPISREIKIFQFLREHGPDKTTQ